MRSARFAEWVLRLVTTPERAASIAGDLLEESDGRGWHWFWAAVLNTAVSHVWSDMRSARGRMLWLAIRGVLEGIVVVFLVFNTIVMLWVELWPYETAPNTYFIPPWAFYGIQIAFKTLLPLLIGWDIAQRSNGREVAAGVALNALMAAFTLTGILVSGSVVSRHTGPYPYAENTVLTFCIGAVCVMAGAVLCRVMGGRATRQAPDAPAPAA